MKFLFFDCIIIRVTMGRSRKDPYSPHRGISELKQVTFLTTRTSTGSKVDVFHQSQPLTQSSDVTHAVRVVKNVTCLSSLISAVRRGRGEKIVSDNSKCIRTSEGSRGFEVGVGGLTSYFLRGGDMDVFWNDPIVIT